MKVFALPLGGLLVLSGMAAFGRPVRAAQGSGGFVYVMTNAAANAVLQFSRATSGQLTFVSQQATGGAGAGTGVDPLTSNDSLVSNGDGSRILAVNAGSNTITSLTVTGNALTAVSTVPSGGTFPNSVALSGNRVYVLNAHGAPNVSGFTLNADGTLQPLAGSTHDLPGTGAAIPHDVRFSPDGSRLLVTDEGTNQIDVFQLDNSGLVSATTTQPSSGAGPFGLRFTRGGVIAVTEASAGAVSSYLLTSQNTLTPISASVPDGGTAVCWLSLTPNGHAFVSNTGSGSLSSYQVAADGQVTLANPTAAVPGSGSAPIDSAFSSDSNFLYVIDSANGRVLAFRAQGNTLSSIQTVTGLPLTVQGIAVQ